MDVVVGVDAHRSTHTLVAVDEVGRKLASTTVGTRSDSHAQAVRWVRARFGAAAVWGVEDCRSVTSRLERTKEEFRNPLVRNICGYPLPYVRQTWGPLSRIVT